MTADREILPPNWERRLQYELIDIEKHHIIQESKVHVKSKPETSHPQILNLNPVCPTPQALNPKP